MMIALGLSPGLLISAVFHDHDYLIASFYSVCSIMPFGEAHTSKRMTYLFAMIIMLYSLVIYTFINQWVAVYFLLALPMTVFSTYERQDKSLKIMSNWWLIGVIYGGFKIQHAPSMVVLNKYILIFLLTLLGAFFALHSQKTTPFKWLKFRVDKAHLRYYIKYPLALLITISTLALFHPQEGEWLIWSCFSVLSLDYAKAKGKYQDRLLGVAFGVSVGFLIIQIIPYSPFLDYIYITCILLSLRLFEVYLYSFAIRCLFVVLYAGSNYQQVGYVRLTDIVLGGAIGIALSYALKNSEK